MKVLSVFFGTCPLVKLEKFLNEPKIIKLVITNKNSLTHQWAAVISQFSLTIEPPQLHGDNGPFD